MHVTPWMNLENIMQSEISHSRTAKTRFQWYEVYKRVQLIKD